MSDPNPSFVARVFLAFGVCLRLLFDAELAGRVRRAMLPPPSPAPESKAAEPEPPARELVEHDTTAALQLLSLLQREGRFVDFLQEDVSQYPDADIGAAARVVHDACKKALDEHLDIEPVRGEAEGSSVTLQAGFDAAAVRLTGNVVGEPPFRGTLTHRGWRAKSLQLPKLGGGHDASILAPAEVEL